MAQAGKRLLENKVIVISGGTKGVGRDLAIACAKSGAKVVIGGRDQCAAQSILDRIQESGQEGKFIFTELHHTHSCKQLFEETLSCFGQVNGFVNYAGVSSIASLLDCKEELFDEVMDINFRAAFFCTKYAVKSMIKNAGGSIVFMNSCHAWHGEKDRCVYACSKGALMTLNDHIAHHYGAYGIRCNLITMGWSMTEGEIALRANQGISEEQLRDRIAKTIPMGRMQESQDYIPGILYLLSDFSKMATGGNVRISGGLFL